MKKSFNEQKNDSGPLQLHEKVIIGVFGACFGAILVLWLSYL